MSNIYGWFCVYTVGVFGNILAVDYLYNSWYYNNGDDAWAFFTLWVLLGPVSLCLFATWLVCFCFWKFFKAIWYLISGSFRFIKANLGGK